MQSMDMTQPRPAKLQAHPAGGLHPAASPCARNYGHGYRGAPEDGPADRWRRNTALLQCDHPKVRLLGMKLTQLKCGERDKAVACYEYVRHLNYGFSGDAMRTPSVSVLAEKAGDGFSKATLFMALLRSLDIACRLRVVLLRPAYLHGIAPLDDKVLEHAFTEVLIEGEWLAVDSYVADTRLAMRARLRLAEDGRSAGYGVHANGHVAWDARSSSFGQFSTDDAPGLPMLDLGAFDDLQHYYRAMGLTRLSAWANRRRWMFASVMANRRLHKLRGQDHLTIAARLHAAAY